ncbi:MAG: hypothetical protein K9L68_14545 [Spirochaetales bacterium]|nr:hypothetical protein [Spirochaetales bacterium]MCF7939808.1 hypothetical protein [Spirochaetales bacterium]
MVFSVVDFVTNQFVLIFFTVVVGLMVGKLKIGRFYLGTSGGLFVGLPVGWAVQNFLVNPYTEMAKLPAYAERIIGEGVVSRYFFLLTLIFFVAAVGLLAARDLDRVIRTHGAKLIVLGFTVPFVGALICYLMAISSTGQDPFAVSGVYTGALTSSPGLAAAIETVSQYGKDAEGMVGFGHAIGYSPGVIMVILAIQLIPIIFRIDVDKERTELEREFAEQDRKKNQDQSQDSNSGRKPGFDIVAFLLVALAGYFLGSVKIYLGDTLGYFSLGATGGVLIAGLLFGYFGRLGPFRFTMDSKILTAIRELSLSLFLAIVGLRYGYATINSLVSGGLFLVFVSFVTAFVALLVGFLIARYVFKLNWVILAGSLCGAMTSTPGLGVAINAVKSDDAAVGYGATYPFALLGMVIFTILLHNLPM